ncbi:MAG: signal peptide peptidase SppA [Bacteroidetes bacterium]|nr:MAG: signal peptide peptidase SppA [Bacteroidota bacterium]
MKQFFKFLLASMVGVFLTLLIVFFIFFGIIASLGKSDPKPVAKNSVYHLELNSEIIDRSSDNPLDNFNFMSLSSTKTIGLNDLLKNIRKAKLDENIEGIFLDLSFTMAGWASMYEIRNELLDFKESGKFIIAYADYMTQGAYYLASVADEVYLNPQGIIDFRGLNAEVVFLKNMLEKIGVEMQVIRYGKFKSAGEPFFRENLSAENREQMQSYLSSMWNTVIKDISEQRNMTVNELTSIADSFQTRTPEGALEAGMIDGIAFRDEIMDNLKSRLELEDKKEVNLVNFAQYNKAPLPDSMLPIGKRDKIAVIYGYGNIVMESQNDLSMGADRISKALRTARKDTTVKAIVFRVNSPGGSALASEIMLREVMLAVDEKPVVVSMGDLAASGGYYVACYASKIIANPNTITGSIGVFGIVPNMKEMFNDKLGITFDNVKTNELADLGSVSRPLNRTEKQIIQGQIDRIYETFIHHVAEGRGLPVAAVDSIAQGRVWSGVDAKRIGLIDDFGGLNYAIEQAAELAGIEKYRIVEYPEQKPLFEQIMEGFGSVEARFMKARLGNAYPIYQKMQQATENSGILMRMPYDVQID